MKKIRVVFFAITAIALLAGCSTNKKEKVAAVTIDGGEYILPQDESTSEGEGFLALEVTLKNETSKSLDISKSDIMLYDEDDSKIEAIDVYPEEGSKTKFFSYEKLSGNKSKTGYVVFPVNKEEKYKLHFEPMIFDTEKEAEPIILEVDASKYKDHSKEVLKAATGFVDEVFLAKENKSYEKLVTNNKEEAIKNFDSNFTKNLKDKFYDYKPTEQEASAIAKVLRETNGKVGKVAYELFYFSPDMATVLVNVEAVTFKEMRSAMTEVQNKFSEQASDMSFEEEMRLAEKAVVDQLPEIIKTTTPVEIDSYGDGFRMLLKKNGKGKWEVQTKGTTARFDSLEQPFRGDY
ncbi:DUF5105 domain-containing protein [Enterococcus rivorum]|uniref:DUF4352 domain-containing protein n=1 Tax=Enterococcus rivorum TaxID=762845 RepID=A0A1E5L024_9ENTE|nr:DUF5105 domain-containing protein [Enterococcus rivorum]MBP2100178.1 hypothetical protein [Enterococcus rivorum]OEH83433.1 hypothetical protein BCR26_09625 [Enterococcus rivorum]